VNGATMNSICYNCTQHFFGYGAAETANRNNE